MSTLTALFKKPVTVAIGGAEIQAHPLAVVDLIELEGAAREAFPGGDGTEIYSAPDKAFRSPAVLAVLLRLLGRKSHPELESDPALAPAMAATITPSQLGALSRVAFAEPEGPKA